MLRIKISSLCILLTSVLLAQNMQTGIGQWRDHIPYNFANSVSANGDIIYCGSSAGFIAFNSRNGEVKRYNTITGLSDIGVTLLKFNENANSLLVSYKNGNLDILEGGKITNISSIKEANNIGDKSINNIRMDGNLAYISTSFGVSVLDMKKAEIKDTYFIGKDSKPLVVYDVYLNHDIGIFYAATEDGVRIANLEDNLSDFNSWSKLTLLPDPDGTYNHIDFFANKLFVNYLTTKYDSDIVYTLQDTLVEIFSAGSFSGTNEFQVEDDRFIISKFYNVLPFDEQLKDMGVLYIYEKGFGMVPSMAIHHQDLYWIADEEAGLAKFSTVGLFDIIAPNGPNTLSINDVDINKEILWGTSGLMDPLYRGSSNVPEFNHYENLEWGAGINRSNEQKLDTSYGYVKIKINPNNPQQVYAGSWDNGVLEILNGKIKQMYNAGNQAETGHTLTASEEGKSLIRVGGMDFDSEQNLWITCAETPYALNVLKKDFTWKRFNLGNFVGRETQVGDVIVTPNGYKWILLNRANSNYRLVVYDDNGTIDNLSDDRYIGLATDEGKGSIPGSTANCISQDKGGAIWIGTDEGPAVFYSPDLVFESQQEAQRIFIQQDGQTQILLETENIKSITIDGANRKWFGTTGSGAYLMSEDATQEINHFTESNSPIFSDEVNDIEINGENGEIYFCTSEGLISYKGSATEGGSGFGNVQVFPNPVDRGYSGPIAIKGLAENANVKITDVNGILVYETTAFGGQALWDGNTIQGSRVKNGVYVIFITDRSGESQEVTKVLFLNN